MWALSFFFFLYFEQNPGEIASVTLGIQVASVLKVKIVVSVLRAIVIYKPVTFHFDFSGDPAAPLEKQEQSQTSPQCLPGSFSTSVGFLLSFECYNLWFE